MIDNAREKRLNQKRYRDRQRRGEHTARMILTERQIDHLAAEGYLDGENTVATMRERHKKRDSHADPRIDACSGRSA